MWCKAFIFYFQNTGHRNYGSENITFCFTGHRTHQHVLGPPWVTRGFLKELRIVQETIMKYMYKHMRSSCTELSKFSDTDYKAVITKDTPSANRGLGILCRKE